jgi:transposase
MRSTMKKTSPVEKHRLAEPQALPPEFAHLEQLHLQAAGIDVGSAEHWVCVPTGRAESNVRSFGCFTPDLQAMAEWLKRCGVTTVAMESTGVYWIPVFQILESAGLEVKLVNAHHLKTVPGRKSDVLDCQWLQKLHTYGLLAGSFRPDDQVCVLRSYVRQRERLIQSAVVHIQRMQHALIQMNLHLHKVISDITGLTGMSIIRAIVAGERNPQALAALKHSRTRSSQDEIAKALSGKYWAELVFILQQELALYDLHQQQIAACDRQIEQCLMSFDAKTDQPPPSVKNKRRKTTQNAPAFDLRGQLYRVSGIDFTQMNGLDALSVQTILSEVGLDSKRFPSVKHFCSWLGLCPGTRITGGKPLSSQTRSVVNRATNAFWLAAQSVSHSHSALGAFYRRLRSRLGAPKAITATAHKIARLFYKLWSTGETYADPGSDYYEQKYRERLVKHLKKTAQSLGFEVVPQSPRVESVS